MVGAGPSGLTLACALARAGVGCLVIDKAAARSPHSRALVIHRRSLEILDQLGATDQLVAAGRQVTAARIHLGRRRVDIDLAGSSADGCRFPHPLMIEQSRTEAALDASLVRLGLAVRFGHELVSFAERADGVSALCRAGDRSMRVDCRYLVGCDGAHSTVRHQKGIAFRGSAYAQDFMLADLDFESEQPRDMFQAFLHRHGFMALFPLRERTRLVTACGRYRADSPPPALEELQELVHRFVPYPAGVRNPVWLARFHLHHRIAKRFSAGRVCLVGDAAHIHSPVGGQGMNTGIGDAWNLGWKLAWALRLDDERAGRLVATYHDERYPFGRSLVRTTDRAFDFVSGQGWLARLARGWIAPSAIPALARIGALRRLATRRISQLAIHYRSSRLSGPGRPRLGAGRALRPGDRMPDLSIEDTPLHRLLDPLSPTLLLVGDARAAAPAFPQLAVPNPTPEELRWLGLTGPDGAFLIRPDGHLAMRTDDPPSLRRARLLGFIAPGD